MRMVFLEIGSNKAKCQYCDAEIEYTEKGSKRGYSYKACDSCGLTNGVAINIRGDVVTFKVKERKEKK